MTSILLKMLNGLPEPFQSKPNIMALCVAYGQQFDHLVRVYEEIENLRDLESADLSRLRQIATLVGTKTVSDSIKDFLNTIPSSQLPPDIFGDIRFLRSLIKGQAFANSVNADSAKLENIKRLFSLLFPIPYITPGGAYTPQFIRLPPKHVQVYTSIENIEANVNTDYSLTYLLHAKLFVELAKSICDPTTSVELVLLNINEAMNIYPQTWPSAELAGSNYQEFGTGRNAFGVY